MKSFLAPALEIMAALLEDEDEDEGLVKEISVQSEEGYWAQIGGDYGDPWVSGGDWFNPVKAQALHFQGIESDEETDPDTIEIPATMLAKLPPEQEDWRDNTDRDRMIQQYQVARAAFIEARKQRQFYLIDVPDELPPWLLRHVEAVKQSVGEGGDFDNWPIVNKLLEIGNYIGFNEIGSDIEMNKMEAEAFLRIRL